MTLDHGSTLRHNPIYVKLVISGILFSFVVRLICAAVLPLSGDEALYWSYSKHLGWGFVDHPVMNPLLIRMGTFLLGDSPLGVRLLPLILSLPATWAVWQTGKLLFEDEHAGATAALIFNLTIAVSVGSFIATSDAAVIATSAFTLYCLAQIEKSDNGFWWLGVGVFVGLGMLSKYTTVFLACGIVLWVVITPQRRRWVFNPYSISGAIISVLLFAPVVIWNWNHEWISFVYQSGRTNTHQFSLRYLDDYIGSQAAFLTPPVFILGILAFRKIPGLVRIPASTRVLILSLVAPTFVYFAWHSLHERVEGNWPEVMYPPFVLAATMSIQAARTGSLKAPWTNWSRRLMLPVGAGLAALVYVQALFGPIPLGRKDPVSRELAYGWHDIGKDIAAIASKNDAARIITSDYTTNSWLRFYLPSKTPVTQINERLRWANEPPPPGDAFAHPVLYICRDSCQFLNDVRSGFEHFELLTQITRTRNEQPIETYSVYFADQPNASPYGLIRKPFIKGQS
jgi:hypothetical protein